MWGGGGVFGALQSSHGNEHPFGAAKPYQRGGGALYGQCSHPNEDRAPLKRCSHPEVGENPFRVEHPPEN